MYRMGHFTFVFQCLVIIGSVHNQDFQNTVFIPSIPCNSDGNCTTENAVCSDNNTCQCKDGSVMSGNLEKCLEVAEHYGGKCEEDIQCSPTLQIGGECIGGICQCSHSYHYYMGQCWKTAGYDESCYEESECLFNHDTESVQCGDDGTCSCVDGYYNRHGVGCRRNKGFGESCNFAEDCPMKDSICDGACICREPLVVSSDNSKCIKGIGAVCKEPTDCSEVDGAECNNGTCSCTFNLTSNNNNNLCVREIGHNCTGPDDCNIPSSICNTTEKCCTCDDGYVQSDDLLQCVQALENVGDQCEVSEQCEGFNGICVENKCTCSAGHHFVENIGCIYSSGWNESCRNSYNCYSGGKMDCIEGICECAQGYHVSTTTPWVCRKILTSIGAPETCLKDDCIYDNAKCRHYCVCADGYRPDESFETCVTGVDNVMNCTEDVNCTGDHKKCVNNQCLCISPYTFSPNEDCIKVAVKESEPCEYDFQCTTYLLDGAACINNECKCSPEYYYANYRCWKKAGIGENCSSEYECHLDGSTCSENGTCSCKKEYTNIGDTCQKTFVELGMSCDSDEDCLIDNFVCSGGTCTCEEGYVFSIDKIQCLPLIQNMADVCQEDAQCSLFGENAACTVNVNCTCNKGFHYVEDWNLCWHSVNLGENCDDDRDCFTASTTGFVTCKDICQCIDGYHSSSDKSDCRENLTGLGDVCVENEDCSQALNNTVCDVTNKTCICDTGYYYDKDNISCVKGVGAACDNTEECKVIGLMECSDLAVCTCTNETVSSEHGDSCLKSSETEEDTCEEDAQCFKVFGEISVCRDAHCSCPNGFHMVHNECYASKGLGEKCTNSNECYNEMNADWMLCRKEICSCEFDHDPVDGKSYCSGAETLKSSAAIFLLVSLRLILETLHF